MSPVTDGQLIESVWAYLDEEGTADPDDVRREAVRAALHELEARADERERGGEWEWPLVVFEAAKLLFGDAIFNRAGGTRKGLDRKLRHAWRVWTEKYGPLTPGQAFYAGDVLASCFRPDLALPQVYRRLDLVVNHETVHAGMLRRAEGDATGAAAVAAALDRVAS